MKDFSIIIQGPLNDISLSNLEYYKIIGNVIISYWDSDDESLLNKYDLSEVVLVKNYYKKEFIRFFNNQNVYFQVYTTFNGLKKVNTKYVIKTRSDNKFEDLEPFIKLIYDNPDKFNCSNLHFRPIGYLPFHVSDILIGGETKLILKTFEICKYRCENDQLLLISGLYDDTTLLETFNKGNNIKEWRKLFSRNKDFTVEKNSSNENLIDSNGSIRTYTTINEDPIVGTQKTLFNNFIGIVPETLIATSFLLAKNIKPDIYEQYEQLHNNFNITRIENLKYVNEYNSSSLERNDIEINNIEELSRLVEIVVKYYRENTSLTVDEVFKIIKTQKNSIYYGDL
jgi:hypothetical protein